MGDIMGDATITIELPADCDAVLKHGFPVRIVGTMPAGVVTAGIRSDNKKPTYSATAGFRVEPVTRCETTDGPANTATGKATRNKRFYFAKGQKRLVLAGAKGFQGTGKIDFSDGLIGQCTIELPNPDAGRPATGAAPIDWESFGE
jgi:hypothetical protein